MRSSSPWARAKKVDTCWRCDRSRAGAPLIESTKNRYPFSVGIRPALVWGCSRKPSCSRTAISLRTVAGDTSTPGERATWPEPTGWAVSMYSWTTARRMAALRSSSVVSRVIGTRSYRVLTPAGQASRLRPRLSPGSVLEPEGLDEGLLGDVDPPDGPHALLAFLLLLEQLALAGDVAPVELGRHVLAEGLHRLAGDHLAADRRLDRDVELLPGQELLQLLGHPPAVLEGLVAVDDHTEGVDLLA